MLTAKIVDDGTVELSESVYRCLVDALRNIAAGPVHRRGERGSMSSAAVAQAALRRADMLSSIPNTVAHSMRVD
jgi:hypothetical protein